jgi:hypothetical protein
MPMLNNIYTERLHQNLRAYKQKYYKNLLLKGVILTAAALLSAFLLANTLEYWGNLGSLPRAALFFSLIGIAAFSLGFWVIVPLLRLAGLNHPISNEEAAQQIGKYFPEVNDKLLNVLQLDALSSGESDLLAASIEQKAKEITVIRFPEAIRYNENRRYLRYLLPPLMLALLILLFVPQLFTESLPRIVQYRRSFAPQAPFTFVLANQDLKAYKNEDFEIQLNTQGKSIPQEVYLLTDNGRRIRMQSEKPGVFTHTLKQVQKNTQFTFEGAGFFSSDYTLEIIERPSLSNFSVWLDYPAYTSKRDEKLLNTGNLNVPEGTQIRWTFNTQQTAGLSISFDNEQIAAQDKGNNTFELSRKLMKSGSYNIQLKNTHSQNKEAIEYYLAVSPDEHPSITLQPFADTTSFSYLIVGGNINDDYGINRLELKYRVIPEGARPDQQAFLTKVIPHNPNAINQSYFFQQSIDELQLKQGDRLEYYVQVWDNDGVRGSKSSKTNQYELKLPSKEEFRKELEAASSKTESEMEKTLEKVQEYQKQLEEVKDKITGKKKLSWEDKQSLENLIKKKDELTKELKEMQERNRALNERQERFENPDEKIAEKAEKLQELMDEILDEETQRLYDQLQKMLEQESQNLNIQEMLEEMEKKENNLEKELDRALEMFKKLELEKKTDALAEDLKEMAEMQEELAEQTQEAQKEDLQQLAEQQEKLNQEFKKTEEKLQELEKLNEEAGKPESKDNMQELKDLQKQTEQKQEQSKQSLEQKQQKQAAQQQKQAAQDMKQMQKKMGQMQQSSEMQQQVEDYNALRNILEGLVKLSFDQEDLMKQFKTVRNEDPRTLALGQKQLKLKDDAKILEDSLNALAKRVFQIRSFVTREVADMNDYIGQSLDEIKKYNYGVAAAKQQLTMTSINNLALMLDEVMHQMQQNLGQQMGGMQIINKKRGEQNLGQQQQMLNQRMMDLMKSGKSGKALSQELAKLAAEQEMIRRALKNASKGQPKQGKNGKKEGGTEGGDGNLGKLLEEMEKTEEDLVNKRLTQETIRRQKEILTRLLESEKAMRERETDNKREAEQAKEKDRKAPAEFSEYLKQKEKQVEILKSIPPSLNPYYKKEVNEYFKKLNNE